MKKKILSAILAMCLLCSMVPSAFAMSDEGQDLYIYSKSCPEEYYAYASDEIAGLLATPDYAYIGEAQLGTPFTFANQNSNVYYFPIYSNGEIELTFHVYPGNDGALAGVLSPAFAKNLNEIATDTTVANPLRIVYDSGDVSFQLDNYEKVVQSTPDNGSDEEDSVSLFSDDFAVVKCEPTEDIALLPSSRATKYLSLSIIETQGGNNWCLAYATATVM